MDPINEEGRTPLFYATQANNQFAACVLLEQGSNVRQKDVHGRYNVL
jgi:ankyrin repeat protein